MSYENDSVRMKTARFIMDREARRDREGRLKVYKLPFADGGGTFEVAGINDRYHMTVAHRLRDLISRGAHPTAEREAVEFIAEYTDIVTRWVKLTAAEAFLRDCCFNRGPKGALRILQLAVGVADDGKFGPLTRAAIKERSQQPDQLLDALRSARERYEHRVAPPVGARAKFWAGLVNRWNKAEDFARQFTGGKKTELTE